MQEAQAAAQPQQLAHPANPSHTHPPTPASSAHSVQHAEAPPPQPQHATASAPLPAPHITAGTPLPAVPPQQSHTPRHKPELPRGRSRSRSRSGSETTSDSEGPARCEVVVQSHRFATPPSPSKSVRRAAAREMAQDILSHARVGEWAPQALQHLLTWLGQMSKGLADLEETSLANYCYDWGWACQPKAATVAYVCQLLGPEKNAIVGIHTALMLPQASCPPNTSPAQCDGQRWLQITQSYKGGQQLL
jgi:hypothetical protein